MWNKFSSVVNWNGWPFQMINVMRYYRCWVNQWVMKQTGGIWCATAIMYTTHELFVFNTSIWQIESRYFYFKLNFKTLFRLLDFFCKFFGTIFGDNKNIKTITACRISKCSRSNSPFCQIYCFFLGHIWFELWI